MLDQNTTTILTALITVGGTLGGVTLGDFLSNRYVARQAKANKNATIIEEVYILLTNIHSEITQNIEFNNPSLQGQQLQDYMRRVQALVYLYLPSVKEKLDIFLKEMFRFSTKVSEAQKLSKFPDIWNKISDPYKDDKKKLDDVKSALEKLVR